MEMQRFREGNKQNPNLSFIASVFLEHSNPLWLCHYILMGPWLNNQERKNTRNKTGYSCSEAAWGVLMYCQKWGQYIKMVISQTVLLRAKRGLKNFIWNKKALMSNTDGCWIWQESWWLLIRGWKLRLSSRSHPPSAHVHAALSERTDVTGCHCMTWRLTED